MRITYAKDVTVTGAIIGLTDDFDLNQPIAAFLAMNESLIPSRLSYIEAALHNYRRHNRKEFEWKRHTLSYRFLTNVYDQPREPAGLVRASFIPARVPSCPLMRTAAPSHRSYLCIPVSLYSCSAYRLLS